MAMTKEALEQATQAATENQVTDISHLPVWNDVDQPDKLPGPPRLPGIGSLLAVGSTKNFYRAMVKWLNQYGAPYYMPLGQFKFICSTDATLAKLLLDARPERARRPLLTELAFESIDAKEMLFSAEGAMWKAHRKAISKSLSSHNLTVAEDMIKAEVDRQIARLDADIRAAQGDEIDFLPTAKRYSITIISRLVFGDDFRNLSTDDSVVQDVGVIFTTLARRISIPFKYWKYFKLPADRRYEKVKKQLDADVRARIEATRHELQGKGDDYKAANLLEGMLIGSEQLSDKEIINNCVGLIAAGLDTTSTTLSWAVFLLGKHPEIQQQLREEVLNASGGTGDLPTLQGIHTLPLLEATIWEALRMYPAAPFIPALTLQDFEYQGKRIPANTTFMFLLSEAEKRQPDHDPTFNPHRWLETGQLAKAVKLLPMPFGTGQRLCPGRNLSVMEMKAMIAGLLARYTWTSPAGYTPQQEFNFTLDPCNMPVRFEPRLRSDSQYKSGTMEPR